VATVGVASATNTGNITIAARVALMMAASQDSLMSLSWPSGLPYVVVEQSDSLGVGAHWTAVTNYPVMDVNGSSVILNNSGGNRFFRIRQSW